MTDLPILYQPAMVRAQLAGLKTQTRRILSRRNVTVLGESWAGKNSPWEGLRLDEAVVRGGHLAMPFSHPKDPPTETEDCAIYRIRPKVEVGDRLWVRESWALHGRFSDVGRVVYMASINNSWTEAHEDIPVALVPKSIKARAFQYGFRPSIHMPRAFSRITNVVTAVKIERLQEISEEDAIAEGVNAISVAEVPRPAAWSARQDYMRLWDSINGKPLKRKGLPPLDISWSANPWVVATTFTVHLGNIDQIKEAA